MTTATLETSKARILRSAGDIRGWVVAELARALNTDPTTIDTAAPLDTLGFDSLVAIGMTGALAAWLDRDLPATLMWDYASIDKLAEGLADAEGGRELPASPGIVTLQGEGDRVPLFCFPGLGGHPAIFSALASHLRPDHPCYGLVVPGLNSDRTPLDSVEKIAAAMIVEIRRVQPSGPYQLAGYSFGGYLAYETAQQLVAAGESVSTLAIYDTFTPAGRVLRRRWERAALHAWLLATQPRHVKHLRSRLKRFKLRQAREAKTNPAAGPSASPSQRRGEAVWLADKHAASNYQPRFYPGSLLLFRATDRSVDSPFFRLDKTNGWAALAQDGVRVIDVPGGHANMLHADHAPLAAAMLRPYLAANADGTSLPSAYDPTPMTDQSKDR